MDLMTAQYLIHQWADLSPRLEHKIAVDTVFTALRECHALAAEVAQWRAQYGDPDPDGHFYD